MSRNLLQNIAGLWSPSLGPSGYTLLDRSGRGNHGTLTNMDSNDWVASPGGWALDFDGINDHVPLNRQYISAGDRFTISAWLKSGGTQNQYACPISQGHFDYQGFAFQYGFPSATTMVFIYGLANNLLWQSLTFGYLPNSNTAWVHLVVTFNGSVLATYRNGIQQATATATPQIGTFNFTIGRDTYNTDTNFRTWLGLIDDVGIWHRGLTAAEVWQLYNLQRGGLGRLAIQGPPRHAYKQMTNRRRRIICGAEC